MRTGLLTLSLVVLVGCTTADPPDEQGPAVSYVTPDRVHEAGRGDTEIDQDLGEQAPLAALSSDDRPLALLPDRLVELGEEQTRDVHVFDPPVLGAEIAHSSRGSAVTAVSWAPEENTRLLWIDSDVEVLLESSGNLPLVGILDEGVLLRSGLGATPVNLLDWDGAIVSLGITALDAILIPDTTQLVVRESEREPMRVLDIESGEELAVDGLPPDVTFSQVAASPTASKVVVALDRLDRDEGEPGELWLIDTSPLTGRSLLPLATADRIVGFSDDGQWVVLLTNDERFGSELVGVRLEDAKVVPFDLPQDATPMGWSRTALTLEPLRPGPTP